jgi:hypothetical protein
MKGMAFARTYSYHVPITIVQALVVSMQVALGTDICHPQLRCFGNSWSGVPCEWVKWGQAVHERKGCDYASVSYKR